MQHSAFLLLILSTAALAQVAPTGSLVGEIKDSSGGAIAGASVIATNSGTQLRRETTTGVDGRFAFTRLPIGDYNLKATASGFSSYEQNGIRVDVDSAPRVPVVLSVGSLNEQVTITADAAMLTTESGALSQVVREKYIQDLPLDGRNAASLVYMVPGTVTGVGTTTAGYANTDETLAVSVNGSRGNEVNFKLDGATHMDNVTNLNAAYPNPDAIAEFSVQTSNFSAQYGAASGAVVTMVTRSGTNALHGSAFEFLRNDTLNARNFFATQRGNLKRNQYGGTLGGPVIRNRLFFFGSYQGTPSRSTNYANVAFVPAAQRAGDFTGQNKAIIDPLTNKPFPNKTIPLNRILPIAGKILDKVPGTGDAGGQLIYGRPFQSDRNQVLGKVDYNAGRHMMSGSLFYNRYTDPGWDGGGTLLTAQIGQVQTEKSGKYQDVLTLRPNLLNTFVASVLVLQSYNTRTSPFYIKDFGDVKIATPDRNNAELELSVTGSSGWGSVSNSPPGEWIRDTYELSDTISYTRGRHSLAAGVEFTPYTKFDSTTNFNQSGNFAFSGQITGVGLADFLLGKVSTFKQSAGKYKRTRGKQVSAFVDDKIRVLPSLVLNLGLRWDPYLPYHDALGQVAGYRPGYRSQRFLNAPVGSIYAGDPGYPDGGMANDVNNFAPRFGFAWSPAGNTKHPLAVRGGYGVFFVRPFPRLYNNFVENAPFSPSVTLFGVDLMDPYGSAGVRNPFPPFAPVPLTKDVPFTLPTGLTYFREDWGVGYSQAWNLTVERQFSGDVLVRAAYVGNKGTHLQSFRERNAAVYGPGATLANTDARRPLYPNYASVVEMVSDGNSHYHAVQLTVERRFSKRFSVLAFYTFSKSIDDESINAQFTIANPNPYNPRFNRGLSDFDVPHNFRMTGIYDFPRLAAGNRLVRGIAGGWTLTGIVDWRSGLPFTLVSGRDNSFSGIGQDRADLLGNPALSMDRSRQDIIRNYFEKSMVAVNAPGTFGNSPRNFLRSPRVFNVDAGIHKRFDVTERLHLQLRGEFFNALNNVHLGKPGVNVSSPASFGIITSAGSPRIAQVSLKLQF